jgi:hypothetical protein
MAESHSTAAARVALLRQLRQTPLNLSRPQWFLWDTHFRLDEEVARVALQVHGWRAYRHLHTELRRRKDLFLVALEATRVGEVHSLLLHLADKAMFYEKEVAQAVVERYPLAFAWPELASFCANRDMVLRCLRSKRTERPRFDLVHTPQLMGDDEVVRAAILARPRNLLHAPAHLLADRELVKRALRREGTALRHLPDAMRDDVELATVAVRSEACAYLSAGPTVRAEREVARLMLGRCAFLWSHMARALRDDPELARLAVARDPRRYACVMTRPKLRDDRALALEAVRRSGHMLRHAPAALRDDREVVLAAVRAHGGALGYASKRLAADPEVVLAALKTSAGAVRHADDALRADAAFARRALAVNAQVLPHLPRQVRDLLECRLIAARGEGASAALLDEADATIRALLARAEDLAAEAAATFGDGGDPALRERAEGLLASTLHPEGLVHRVGHKRAYAEAMGEA